MGLEVNKIYQGECLEVLKTFPDKCINMVMTSPPYWALRDYGVDGQLGLEPKFDEYISKLCDIFDEVKRVLRDDGTIWVNLGDTYWGGGQAQGHTEDTKQFNTTTTIDKSYVTEPKARGNLYQDKSLVMIPMRFALEMVNRGWILRNTIIWHKPNCMPSSVSDRFTVDFEYVFFFSKKKKYYFEQQLEPTIEPFSEKRAKRPETSMMKADYIDGRKAGNFTYNKLRPEGRNKRTTWTICPRPFSDAHFAVYPEELCETPIKAGCPKEVCSKCGKPVEYKNISIGWVDDPNIKEVIIKDNKPYSVQNREGYVEVRDLPLIKDIKKYLNDARNNKNMTIKEVEDIMDSQAPHHWFSGESYPSKEDWLKIKDILKFDDKYDFFMTNVKYKPAEKLKARYEKVKIVCDCNVGFEPGVVLDPFFGSGTTGVVALKQQKRFVGIELNPEYIKIAEKRLKPYLEQSNLSEWVKE